MIQDFGWFFIKTMWVTRFLNLHQYSWGVLILITIAWCITSWCIDMIFNQMIADYELEDSNDTDIHDENNENSKDEK